MMYALGPAIPNGALVENLVIFLQELDYLDLQEVTNKTIQGTFLNKRLDIIRLKNNNYRIKLDNLNLISNLEEDKVIELFQLLIKEIKELENDMTTRLKDIWQILNLNRDVQTNLDITLR